MSGTYQEAREVVSVITGASKVVLYVDDQDRARTSGRG